MKFARTILICATAMLFVSCAHFSKPLDQSFHPDTNASVIYGRFELGPEFSTGNQLALWLAGGNSNTKYIQFKNADPISCIPVKPGRYNIIGFIGTDVDHRIWGRQKFRKSFQFNVPSNSAVYLGDFAGSARYDFAGMLQEWTSKESRIILSK
jgi:hypothetical protein